MKTDRLGNMIGDGKWHVDYNVMDFGGKYPQVTSSVSMSETTESVYVTYYNSENGKSVKVRFSLHISNAEEFGDVLDKFATEDEILCFLGLKKRVFVPKKSLYIDWRSVKKSEVQHYETCNITLKEMYELGEGADLSAYTGKLAKDSNRLILGKSVATCYEYKTDRLGIRHQIGTFVYSDID